MKTKGEVLISGLDQIREGLDMISNLGDGNDLVRNIIGSPSAAQRLKSVMNDKSLIYNLVISMVAARNSKLNENTVRKVVNDFLDVLFDLSKPYHEEEQGEESDHTSNVQVQGL